MSSDQPSGAGDYATLAVASRRLGSPDQEPKERPPPSSRRSVRLIAIVAVVVVVLALALGLGLGLGLRSRNSGSPQSAATLPGRTGNGTRALEDWRLDPKEYEVDMNWDLTAPPTDRHYSLVISEGQGWPDGVVRDMLFINGKFPGPKIEVNRGDRIIVNVTNQLSRNSTTMHWHGLFQNGTNYFDGTEGITQCGIPPGQSLLYNFTVTGQFGTYWYHSHTSMQYTDGVLGPLIIHAPEEVEFRKLYDHDQIVLLQDWYHDFSTVNLGKYLIPDNENSEPVPDNGLVNGFNYFNCSLYDASAGKTCYDNSTYTVFNLTRGSKTRFRVINVGAFAEFSLSIDNHSLTAIEADGTLVVPNTTPLHRIPIHVAQRYSFIVNANQSADTSYWLRGSMVTSCFTGDNPVLDPTTKAVISYSGNPTLAPTDASMDWADANPARCVDLDPSTLVPAIVARPPPATKFYRIDFSFGIGAYQMDYAKVNGTTWHAPSNRSNNLVDAIDGLKGPKANAWGRTGVVGDAFDASQFVVGVSNDTADVVDILLYSLDEGGHPFHLHGHDFWVLQTGAGPFNWTHYYDEIMGSGDSVANALRRDTLTVQTYSWALIRFVADNPGLWAFHCHISWHMEAGLMFQIMSQGSDRALQEMKIPQDVQDLCKAY